MLCDRELLVRRKHWRIVSVSDADGEDLLDRQCALISRTDTDGQAVLRFEVEAGSCPQLAADDRKAGIVTTADTINQRVIERVVGVLIIARQRADDCSGLLILEDC